MKRPKKSEFYPWTNYAEDLGKYADHLEAEHQKMLEGFENTARLLNDAYTLIAKLRDTDWIEKAKERHSQPKNHGAWAYVKKLERQSIAYNLIQQELKK